MVVPALAGALMGGCPAPMDTGSPTTDGTSDATDSPEDCETRQQRPDEGLAGATDLQAICDPDEGVVALHRPSDAQCDTSPAPIDACKDPGGECQSDDDCTAQAAGGRCASFDGVGGACACVLPCTTDEDCAPDRACICRSAVFLDDYARPLVSHTGCWPAECRTDDDCGTDGQCAMANPGRACVQIPSLACRGPADVCQSDLDCELEPGFLGGCAPAPSGNGWACVQEVCG